MAAPKKAKAKAFSPKMQARFIAIVFASSFLIYINTIGNGYALDDDVWIQKNLVTQKGIAGIHDIFTKPSLSGFNNLKDEQYRPMPLLSFAIEKTLFGNNPHYQHFMHLLYWGLSNVMLFLLLIKLFKNASPYVPLAMTLMFAFHPVHSEVVSNIKSRDDMFVFLFGVTCLWHLMKYIETKQSNSIYYSLLFFFLTGVSKENGLTFIAIVPLVIFTFTDFNVKRTILQTIPFMIVFMIIFLIRKSVLQSVTYTADIPVVNNSLKAATNVSDMYATNMTMMGKYLWLLIFPHPLCWDYSYNQFPIVGWTNFNAFSSTLIYLALIVYASVKIWKKDVYAFCILFFIITILPTSNLIVKIQATFAERFLFLPSLGFCIAIILLLYKLFQKDLNTGKLGALRPLNYMLPAVFVLYSFCDISRASEWKSNTTLFRAGLTACPNSARVHFAVASDYRALGDSAKISSEKMILYQQAVDEYDAGLKIYDKDAEVYYNLGVSYFSMGNVNKALEIYSKALQLRPAYTMALNNVGVIYFNAKKYDDALGYFLKAVRADSTFSDALGNVGAVYHNKGSYQQAIYYYEKAVRLNPGNRNIISNMSKAYNAVGNTERANYYLHLAR
jgi:tetratricopeptide (TPR) repeat protein